MRLKRARVTKYRSIRDTGWFDVEKGKTILVGPNEAGKSAVLEALQQLNPPQGVRRFDALRDYPRSEYNDITTGKVDPQNVTAVEGHFELEDEDKNSISEEFRKATYVFGRKLNNEAWHRIDGAPEKATYGGIKKDLIRLCAHVDARAPRPAEGGTAPETPTVQLATVTSGWTDATEIKGDNAAKLSKWIETTLPLIDATNAEEERRYDALVEAAGRAAVHDLTLKDLHQRPPVFVLFNNYCRVKPLIHLAAR